MERCSAFICSVKRKRPRRHGSAARVSIIIPVMNERRTLAAVLREAKKVSPHEIIVVANGSTDGSGSLAESLGARVISIAEPLGHDVGRSVGARHATGDVLLFLDGDMVIAARKLKPFIRAVQSGCDVALNRYLGPIGAKRTHPVVLAKHALNAALKRPDLAGASMTTVPHAISRRALMTIGAEALTVPPKAQVLAILSGLKVRAVHLVGVGKLNKARNRPKSSEGMDVLGSLIVGDHLEAMRVLIQTAGERGGHTDLTRNRDAAR
ncbi:glycosyltransferase [Paenibacillus sp. YYML68]|uniref:glycosyltransferase family 2 protein n=1 Tax=Paenibacillus sp. YYML68 TaxID=2909250 RepID=UPI00248FFA55|nr:glycosyltransferase [Paenibacillus sp. YYML68]